MKKIELWSVIILLVVSVIVNIGFYRKLLHDRQTFRIALQGGFASYRIAEADLKNGVDSKTFFDSGMAFNSMDTAYANIYLNNDNISKLNEFMQASIYNRAKGKYNAKRAEQDKHLFNVIFNTFTPFLKSPYSVQ